MLVPEDDPRGRDAFLEHLAAHGVGARALWRPLHDQPPYRRVPWSSATSDVAGDLFQRGVSLPCATELTEDDQERVVAAVRSHWG